MAGMGADPRQSGRFSSAAVTNHTDGVHIPPPRVAAVTMARDEADMLPRWLSYYGSQFGVGNLLVIDDNSVDGSTDDLPCQRYRLPPGPWAQSWAAVRRKIVNNFTQGLLSCYDVVVFTDVDEFLVPDPAEYTGLIDYLSKHPDDEVMAPVGVNLLHDARTELPLDSNRPVLAQRRLVKFAPGMCKPLLKRIPANWSAGFHGIKSHFEIDRELLLIHLKYFDVQARQAVVERRLDAHVNEGRGGSVSAWTMGQAELTDLLQSWVDRSPTTDIPEFDPHEPDLSGIVEARRGYSRSSGPQLQAMRDNPLRQLPERYRTVL